MTLEQRIAMRDDSQDAMTNAICASNIFKFLNVTPRIYLPLGAENSTQLIFVAAKVLKEDADKKLKSKKTCSPKTNRALAT